MSSEQALPAVTPVEDSTFPSSAGVKPAVVAVSSDDEPSIPVNTRRPQPAVDIPANTNSVLTISSDSEAEASEVQRRRPPTRANPSFRNADVPQLVTIRLASTPGRNAPQALCKTKIRLVGYVRSGTGVVAPTFVGKTTYTTGERDYRFWFSPNKMCHIRPGAPQCREQMPFFPEIVPVKRGTGLTQEEIDFLTNKGIRLVSRIASTTPTSEAEIKV
ncbi:hypothetical protein R1sor_001907 [Riccia sorocarpa]|uniref:Uncharacterized protein n=1 Tax=Riccia sorocarpa TaxID=122646 RepID=A0ABD3H0F2_9MARC